MVEPLRSGQRRRVNCLTLKGTAVPSTERCRHRLPIYRYLIDGKIYHRVRIYFYDSDPACLGENCKG
jgi:hypothetical protein